MRLIANTFLIATEPTVFNSWVTYVPRTAFQLIERLFRYYLMLALPALVGLILLRYEIITLFTTSEYATGSAVVIYVSLAIFMHGYSLIVGLVFDATKRTMIPFVTFLIAALFNVVINLFLLARFGYKAAAWSTCAGYGLLLVLNVIAARRIVHLQIVGGYLWRIGLATAGMGGLIYFLQQRLAVSLVNLFLQVAIAVVVYILFLLIVKGLEEAEILAVKHRAQQILTRALGLVRYKVEAS
jgi:O-antigen/teichoic acid export membrane protein